MTEPFQLLDVIALIEDLPEQNLWRGQVGTIVEILADGQAFEVEFSDREGQVYASLGLRPGQIMRLHFEQHNRSPILDLFGTIEYLPDYDYKAQRQKR
ncbi:MAG: DUF4926 domain-containing protein [Chloroflexi bacterium]|nr:DUF4926 domain-containing protein [Chloroflexota bacterium]